MSTRHRSTTGSPLERHRTVRGHDFYPPAEVLARIPGLYGTEPVPTGDKTIWLHWYPDAAAPHRDPDPGHRHPDQPRPVRPRRLHRPPGRAHPHRGTRTPHPRRPMHLLRLEHPRTQLSRPPHPRRAVDRHLTDRTATSVVVTVAVADPEIDLLAVLRWCPGRSPLGVRCRGPVCQGRLLPARPCPFQRPQTSHGQGRRSRAQRSLEGGGAVA